MLKMYWADASEASEKREIIEFIDYVFSKAHRPHDFTTLLPKLYGERGNGAKHHFVVREDGRIAATVLVYPVSMHIGERTIMTLGVGSVSTHPGMRGRGYMQLLMDAVDAKAEELGAACAVLGGQLQRYQYFGYDRYGYELRGRMTRDNARHALGGLDVTAYEMMPMTQAHVAQAMAMHARQACRCERSEAAWLDVLRSWNNEPFALKKEGRIIGTGAMRQDKDEICISELLLEDERDFPAAMKLIGAKGETVAVSAAPWERQRAKWLAHVCERVAVQPNEMFKFYDRGALESACASLDGFLPQAMALYVAPPDCV